MDVSIKVVIFVDDCTLSMELVFGVLQRNVFADKTLDVHVITSKVTEVKALAEYIEKCSFSNMNDLVVTDDYHTAFRDADYLLFAFNLKADESNENLRQMKRVVEMAKLFDRWANETARVLVISSQSATLLQIFAEVATNLSRYNFTGLSRHYASKATILVAQKLGCRANDLSNLYVWGDHVLDLNSVREKPKWDREKNNGLRCALRGTGNVIDRLPVNWIDNALTPQIKSVQTNGHAFVHAVCQHMIDWCQGTRGRTVCMTIVVLNPGRINDGVYSSYPVVVDENGNVSVVRTVDTDSLLKVKLYAFHESQQMERYRIRNFISNLNKTADD